MAGIGFSVVALFYHPPPRVNSLGLSNREIIARIDFIGGALMIPGLALFLLGIQWGGSTLSNLKGIC
jgi:Fungal trichothecene efflux pump (TRI12)